LLLPESKVTLSKVVFTNDGVPINEPEAGDITATGIITNSTGNPIDAMVIVASYNDNELCDVSLSYKTLNIGDNEFESDPVTVMDTLSIVKVFVWNQANNSPLVEPAYLKKLSSEKLIKSFDVKIGGTIFKGDINQDTKEIYVYVPTLKRGSSGNNLSYSSSINPDRFNEEKRAITPIISGVGVISAEKGGKTQDFSSPVRYIVTAEDGSTVTYTAHLVQTILQRSTDFEEVELESINSKPKNPERWYMPFITPGHVGYGIWTAQRYAFDANGNYVTDTSTPVSYTDNDLTQTAIITGITDDPAGSGSKVFKFEKREAQKSVASVNIKSADNFSTCPEFVPKVICEFDFMFERLEGDGVFLRAAGSSVKNYQLVFSPKGASAGKYKLRSRVSGEPNVTINDVPGMSELAFNSWHKLKLVHSSTMGTPPYTQKVEIYVDDEYVTTLENSGYDSKINTREFNITYFGNPTFGTMYIDNWKLSFVPPPES